MNGRTEKLPPPATDYEADEYWRKLPLTPAQTYVHDITIDTSRSHASPLLEVNDTDLSSALVSDHAKHTKSADLLRIQVAKNAIERARFRRLEEQYGWIKHLRLDISGARQSDTVHTICRWTHVSSKFPEYLAGFLWSLSDHDSYDAQDHIPKSIHALDEALERHRRHSKHGEYFTPFCEPLLNDEKSTTPPMLISCPWMDWSVSGPPPPLRFQIDRREGFQSSRTSSHLLRSILQHYYRLEDTTDREKLQAFTQHKPWTSNKELDLHVRSWYGHYPTSLVVDEVWILIIDSANIVTFSSNVSWKSRWPPLQLSSRIANVSFRNFRNTFGRSWHEKHKNYDTATHAVVCLGGAVGMLHRSFWPDLPLCLTDRFAGYLGHLQYRLHRAPSTKLVMSLISCYDELNIVIQITQQQMDLLVRLQSLLNSTDEDCDMVSRQRRPHSMAAGPQSWEYATSGTSPIHTRATYMTTISAARATTPLLQAIDNLQRELVDLEDLRDNTNALITRTIQLVNIRLEDNGKSILVFTVVTIIFLPLNFIASFFGMNVSDIRNLDQTQALFWIVACCVTAGVAALSMFVAFQGSNLMENFRLWRDNRDDAKRVAARTVRTNAIPQQQGFNVYGASRLNALTS